MRAKSLFLPLVLILKSFIMAACLGVIAASGNPILDVLNAVCLKSYGESGTCSIKIL